MHQNTAPITTLKTVSSAEQAVMRKVSRRLLGFLFLCFVLSFLDRINIGFAGLTMMGDLVGIAVINAFGNIGSALNPLVVGWLKDLTQSFTAGIVSATVLLALGALLTLLLPLPTSRHAQVP